MCCFHSDDMRMTGEGGPKEKQNDSLKSSEKAFQCTLSIPVTALEMFMVLMTTDFAPWFFRQILTENSRQSLVDGGSLGGSPPEGADELPVKEEASFIFHSPPGSSPCFT